jgi:AcrR family transcriptional regulator
MLRAMKTQSTTTEAVRPYSSPLRERQMEQTRVAIFQATAEQLSDHGITDFNIPLIAERAGVAVRTVYRYFPTKDALLDEFAFWLDRQVGPTDAVVDAVKLPDAIQQMFRDFDDAEQMIRSQWATPHGRAVREKGRLRRKAAHTSAIEQVASHLTGAERRGAVAVIAYLCSSRAWQVMKDEHGMDGAESGEAVAWAVRTLIADLRRRDAAAVKAKANKGRRQTNG